MAKKSSQKQRIAERHTKLMPSGRNANATEAEVYADRRPHMDRFLARYLQCGRLVASAEREGLRYDNILRWAERWPDTFGSELAQARKDVGELLVAEAWRRSVDGVERPVYQAGALVGQIREYSDGLLTLLLRSVDPRFHPHYKAEISGPGGGPIQTAAVDLSTLSTDDVRKLLDIAASLPARGGATPGPGSTPGGDEPA